MAVYIVLPGQSSFVTAGELVLSTDQRGVALPGSSSTAAATGSGPAPPWPSIRSSCLYGAGPSRPRA